jgi:translocator assembly and maintenance protein 41
MACCEEQAILSTFPKVDFAFTYGSGAIQQGGYSYHRNAAELPMIDMIFVVNDALSWHEENMRRNPSHYTSLLPMNYQQVAWFQQRLPAHLWFNAYIPIAGGPQAGRLLKYGVISRSHLMEDLQQWSNLYIAGRLHKPVNILQGDTGVEAAMKENREAAVRTALLLLPDQFTEIDLFMAVASLSYVGDPRMIVGENPRKVRTIAFETTHPNNITSSHCL